VTTDHPHLALLMDALDAERRWQEAEYARLMKLDIIDRVAGGMAWSPLEVADVVEAGRGRVIVTLRGRKGTVLHDGISAGDPVLVGPVGTAGGGQKGICVGVEGRTAEVRTDGPFASTQPHTVTVQLDSGTLRWFRSAVEKLQTTPSDLRDVLLGIRETTPCPDDLPISRHFARLNASQRRAARIAMAAPELALIHGPPGTGKTHLLVALLRAMVDAGEKPWALAASNAAVDHLAVGAAGTGLNVVRIGPAARIGSAASDLHVESRILRGPLASVLRTLDRDMVRLRQERGREGARQRRALREERDRIARQARELVLESADVIASTLGSLVRRAPHLRPARTAVIDEATQAIEPAILAVVPWVERMVLVGDPNQLGPVVKQPGNPLERSLLGRLTDPAQGHSVAFEFPMLEVQHRMNVVIQALVRNVYGAGLTAHPDVADSALSDLAGVKGTALTHTPVQWVDTAGAGSSEVRDPISRSLFNPGEAAVVAIAVAHIKEAGVRPEDIGVIAPYNAQVAHLSTLPELAGVEVATVNGFQGREKEAIICTWVRSNEDGELGFVADPRRLTVALTRARSFLLCVGDSATLTNSRRFAELLDELTETGAWRTVWEPPWDAALTN